MARILAIDQGTTATTAVVIDSDQRLLASVSRELPPMFPKPGWVEHDPERLWTTVVETMAGAIAAAGPGPIAAIGITNQRETTLLWDRATGRAIHPAIVWQDRRTADACERLRHDGREPLFRERTGLVLDPYFSGTKLRWLLDEVPGARARAERGELAFGTVETFLLWRLTAGAIHATDVSNASRTLLLGLRSLTWDDELLRLLAVPRACLPEVRSCAETFGATRNVPGIPDGIPICGMAGDQQAALFGQICFARGEVKCTYGTGAFVLANTGASPAASRHGLLSTVAWRRGADVRYALEGSAFVAGAAVQWLRDGLGVLRTSKDVEALARSVPDSGGVVFVPALTGLGAPHWNPAARGLIHGITRGTTAAHLARATLEGIALQVRDLVDAMRADAACDLSSLKVDGGAAANDLLMQIQADLLGCEIVRPSRVETTVLGAALLAGLGAGVWASEDEVRRGWKEERRFRPMASAAEVAPLLERWREAVARA